MLPQVVFKRSSIFCAHFISLCNYFHVHLSVIQVNIGVYGTKIYMVHRRLDGS